MKELLIELQFICQCLCHTTAMMSSHESWVDGFYSVTSSDYIDKTLTVKMILKLKKTDELVNSNLTIRFPPRKYLDCLLLDFYINRMICWNFCARKDVRTERRDLTQLWTGVTAREESGSTALNTLMGRGEIWDKELELNVMKYKIQHSSIIRYIAKEEWVI